MGIRTFEFSTEDEKLARTILKMFQEKKINCEMEYSYRMHEVSLPTEKCPDGYQVRKISKDFLKEVSKGRYCNSSMVMERLEMCWNTMEDFLKKSSGFVMIKDDEIVGIILGSGRYQNYLAIDIEVEKEHRQKGLAKILALYFVKDCITNSVIPHWDCIESNKASIHLVESLGFRRIKERPFYWFTI